MWEKIGGSSGIVIGAVILFLIFVFVVYFIEKQDEKAQAKRKKTPYLVPRDSHGHKCNVKPLRNSTSYKNNRTMRGSHNYPDTRARKIG